jgi:Tol biopolymer transport system component
MRWVDRTQKSEPLLNATSELTATNAYYPTLSPIGRTIALSAFRSENSDLWLIDVDRQIPSPLTSDSASEVSAVWSPDGSELAYASSATGFYNIYRRPVSPSGKAARISEAAVHQYPTAWSGDGQTIVYTQVNASGGTGIYTMPARGGASTLLLDGPSNEYGAKLSPNGKWVAFTSDESGRAEVFVQRFPSGEKVRVSPDGGSEPQWRRDGTELYYLSRDRRIHAVGLSTSPALAAERPQRIIDVPVEVTVGPALSAHYTVTPDGQRFLLSVSNINHRTTTLVLNWLPRTLTEQTGSVSGK